MHLGQIHGTVHASNRIFSVEILYTNRDTYEASLQAVFGGRDENK